MNCWKECKNGPATLKSNFDNSVKVETDLPYDPTIPFLGVYSRELKTYIHARTCIRMFMVALSIIAKKWTQSKCLSTNEWMDEMWCILMMEYYLAIKNNEVQILATTWMNLEHSGVQERSQIQNVTYCMIPFI